MVIATLVGEVIVAIIACIGTIYSAQSKKNSDLMNFRIEVLEKKIDKQENIEKEMISFKEQLKNALSDIQDIQNQLKF